MDVEYNEGIDDDAVPALLILEKLQYLSLLGTDVTMSGVRRLAATLGNTSRFADVEIPIGVSSWRPGLLQGPISLTLLLAATYMERQTRSWQ